MFLKFKYIIAHKLRIGRNQCSQTLGCRRVQPHSLSANIYYTNTQREESLAVLARGWGGGGCSMVVRNQLPPRWWLFRPIEERVHGGGAFLCQKARAEGHIVQMAHEKGVNGDVAPIPLHLIKPDSWWSYSPKWGHWRGGRGGGNRK